MLWDVTYATLNGEWLEHGRVIQVEADTISRANEEAKRIIGRYSGITRIDPATPTIPDTDPAKRKVQGT